LYLILVLSCEIQVKIGVLRLNVFPGLQSFEATSNSVHNLVLCVCSVISFTVTFASFGPENILTGPRNCHSFYNGLYLVWAC